MENSSQRNMSNATTNPISIAGMSHKIEDCPPNAEPIINPTIIMLKESRTMLNEIRLLIRSSLFKKFSALENDNSIGSFFCLIIVFKSRIVSGTSANVSLTSLHSFRSEEHTSELQSRFDLVCRPRLDKTKEQQR